MITEVPHPTPMTSRVAERLAWRGHDGMQAGARTLAEEVAIAFVYGGTSYAVMMATPDDFEDFAIGFALTEGIITAVDQLEALFVSATPAGISLNATISPIAMDRFWARRRFVAGPSGCGLCGIETLEQAMRPSPPVTGNLTMTGSAILSGIDGLRSRQRLNRETHSVHAAAFWHPAHGIAMLREDIGRHNALDKLAGALAGCGMAASEGAILLTSRISVELIQKAATIGAPILVGISAPTALAVQTAAATNMTLVAVARDDGFEVFTHPERIVTTH